MVGFPEVLIAVGAIAALAGGATKKLIKDKKVRLAALVGGIFVALVGLQMGGYFALLTQGPAAPKAAGLWDAVWDTGASDTDRSETETISTDQRTVFYVMSDANMDGLGDVNMGAVLLNKNTGLSTELYGAEVSIVSIGTVIVSGIPTPVANYTADRTRFNIAYTEDSGGGTWTQVFDKFVSADLPTGSSTALSIDLPIDPAVADDLPAGGSFDLVYSVAGITLTVHISES